jgi:hypothetical protein
LGASLTEPRRPTPLFELSVVKGSLKTKTTTRGWGAKPLCCCFCLIMFLFRREKVQLNQFFIFCYADLGWVTYRHGMG